MRKLTSYVTLPDVQMKQLHKTTLDRVKIMKQAISTKVPNLENALSSYFFFNFFIKICINLIKALVVFTISKLLLERILFPHFYYKVTTRTEIMFCHKQLRDRRPHQKYFCKFQALHFGNKIEKPRNH